VRIFQAIRLAPWEEGVFKLNNLVEDDGSLVASGGKVMLRLPLEMKADLANCMGRRIAIIRTDADYRMRVLDDPDH